MADVQNVYKTVVRISDGKRPLKEAHTYKKE
jgi:hypothetical protein